MRLRVIFLLFLAGWHGAGLAEDVPTTAEAIQARLEAVDKSGTLEEQVKVAIRGLYQQALAELKTAAKEEARAERFSQTARTAPEDLGRSRRELSLLPEAPDLGAIADDSLDALQQRLTEREAELAERQTQFDQLLEEPKRRALRRRDIPKQRAAVRTRLEEVQRQLEASPSPDEPPELVLARRTLLESTARALQATLAAGNNELDAYQATIDLLPLQTDLAAARMALLQREVKMLRAVVDRRRRSEVDQHLLQAAEDVAGFAGSDLLAARAKANLQLVERRKILREKINENAQELAEIARIAADLEVQRTRIEDKVDNVGLTGAVGLMLREQKPRLPDVSKHRQAVRQRQPDLKAAQFTALELGERRTDLADLDAALARAVEQIETATGKPLSEDDRQQMQKLLAAERRYTVYLAADANTYVEQLLEIDGAQRQLIADTEQLAQYIDERVLWVRSAETLSAAELGVAFEAVRHLVRLQPWRELGAALVADVRNHFVLYCFLVAVVAAAHAAGWRMRFRRLNPRPDHERPSRFARLMYEVLEIALCAAAWPLLLWFVGDRLSGVPSESGFVGAFGVGLASLGLHLLPLSILFRMCRQRGFAQRRLGWSKEGVRRIRAILGVLMLLVLPLAFVHVSLGAQGNVRWQDSLGRLCLVVNLLIITLVVERVLRPRTGVLYRTLRPPHHTALLRLRWPLYFTGVGVHLGLAVIAVVGFTYAADRLGQQVLATELLLLCLLLVGSLLTQWTRLNARRLAIRRVAERRAAAAAAEQAAEQAVELGLPHADAGDGWFVEPKRSDNKMRSLITTVLVLGGVIGLWYIWVDVIPALSFINDAKMWDSEIAAAPPAAEGEPGDATVPQGPNFVPVTLGDVLLAAFILLGTVVVARYIGGLFELPVVERFPLDSALRNSITTVARYLLWIGGVVAAAGCLGITWGKVQWMVAALSLGLGFGLQEIFANFISGLIILFERPMRVGDVITIGDTTGVVQAIRMRATTITDWDRKELVVPNKEFATGRLLNWTLTNKTNRRVIEVGVEYGTDPDLVRSLLLKVAHESPRVLNTPKPIALFQRFTDSALLFSLRVYHPKISDRLQGLHELNTAIQRELTQAGIKFAFPQRDLHLRTPQPPISWFGPEEEKNEGGVGR